MHRRLAKGFATTRWTVLRAAAGGGGPAESALDVLCRDYWEPVHGHVLHRVGDVHLAEDLTQEFFSKFLHQELFLRPREDLGRFRTFLLTVLRRFLNDEFRRNGAWKRGGRTLTLSLDELPEIADDSEAGLRFDRAWARTLVQRACHALRQESDTGRFDRLAIFLQREPGPGEYQALADELHLTPNTLAAAVKRLRRRFRDLLRAEVVGTLARDEDVEEEMRHLLHVLAA